MQLFIPNLTYDGERSRFGLECDRFLGEVNDLPTVREQEETLEHREQS